MDQRKLDVVVISDLHLATHACKAKQLLKYLKSISPKTLVLNGDIIDSWRFTRNYFPKPQLKLVRYIIKMLEKGVHVFYLSGNHDEFLRSFNNIEIANLKITDQLVLDLNGQKTWIFHGDIFDHIIHRAKWLAKFGAATYGLLTIFNKAINTVFKPIGFSEVALYKHIRKKIIRSTNKPSRFEESISKAALSKNCQTVICGHTHFPKEQFFEHSNGKVHYINCGDWVEHLTAAEYCDKKWKLYYFFDEEKESTPDDFEITKPVVFYKNSLKEMAAALL